MKSIHQFNEPVKAKHKHERPNIQLSNQSGFSALKQTQSHSIDLVTASLFHESEMPLLALWPQLKRVLKPTGNFIVIAPMTVLSKFLITGRKYFNHDYVYALPTCITPNKPRPCRDKPIPSHLGIAVFSFSYVPQYFPQLEPTTHSLHKNPLCERHNPIYEPDYADFKWPDSVIGPEIHHHREFEDIRISNPYVELYGYLLDTYTLTGQKILDLAANSSDNAVASLLKGRDYTGYIYCSARFWDAKDKLDWASKHLKYR